MSELKQLIENATAGLLPCVAERLAKTMTVCYWKGVQDGAAGVNVTDVEPAADDTGRAVCDNLTSMIGRKHKPGRDRSLTDSQVAEIRMFWENNQIAWRNYRSNPRDIPVPIDLTITKLAETYKVSWGVINAVIDRKGAYAD